jgi:hypothetical protein
MLAVPQCGRNLEHFEVPAAQACAIRDRARERSISGGESGPVRDEPPRKNRTVF